MQPIIAAAVFLSGLAAASYSCIELDVPVSFTAPSYPLTFPPFEDHYQTVNFLDLITQRNAASLPSPVGDPVNITVDATIKAFYCTPAGQKPQVVQVLTHGLGFDHTYWDFGGPGSEYNYIDAATSAGYATLSYDRLGNGESTIKNPYTVQQLGVETGVAVTLTTLLRTGKLSRKIPIPSKVVHVGHSYGSAISSTLIANAPSLSDGVVLTGYSTVSTYGSQFAISSNLHIAHENQDRLSAYKSNGWLTWGDELANQYSFFHYPAFDPAVLAEAEAKKFPFAVGEFLTGSAPPPADAFKGPVMVSLRRPATYHDEYKLRFPGIAHCWSVRPHLLRRLVSRHTKEGCILVP